MMRIRHWQDIASLLLGVWLVISPWAIGFAGASVWVSVALGIAVMLFAVEGLLIPSYLEEWGEVLLGLSLLIAPWAVGYESPAATWSSLITGVGVIVFAVWEMLTDREFFAWWHDRSHGSAT